MSKKKEIKTQVSIMLEPSIIKKIEKMAKTIGISRSDLMRNMLLNGYDDAKVLNTMGFLKAYGKGKALKDKIKNALTKGKLDVNENGQIIEK